MLYTRCLRCGGNKLQVAVRPQYILVEPHLDPLEGLKSRLKLRYVFLAAIGCIALGYIAIANGGPIHALGVLFPLGIVLLGAWLLLALIYSAVKGSSGYRPDPSGKQVRNYTCELCGYFWQHGDGESEPRAAPIGGDKPNLKALTEEYERKQREAAAAYLSQRDSERRRQQWK